METSNLIALGALIVAVLGLIPQFYQIYRTKKSIHQNVRNEEIAIDERVINANKSNEIEDSNKKMPFPLIILLLVIIAVATFLIEIIIFSTIAYFCGVEVSMDMPLIWNVIFISLFFIPGAFLFLALLVLAANTTD